MDGNNINNNPNNLNNNMGFNNFNPCGYPNPMIPYPYVPNMMQGMPFYPYGYPQYMLPVYPMVNAPLNPNQAYVNNDFIDAQVDAALDNAIDQVDNKQNNNKINNINNINFYDMPESNSVVTNSSNNINMDNINDIIQNKAIEVVNNSLDDLKVETLKKNYIVFDNVKKQYVIGTAPTVALDNVSLSIDEGELVIFLGHSGAGKTTALNMLGGMDTVTSGKVLVDGVDITEYDSEELTEYRRKEIGFVFQFYNLIQNLSAQENIELSTEISKDKLNSLEVLEEVGLKDCANKFPNQLSGGEQQRVAIARALAKKPKILLCDEPTGALDYKTGKQILKLLQNTCKKNKITTVIITHNQALTPMADKIIYFNSGKIVGCKVNPKPVDVEAIEW